MNETNANLRRLEPKIKNSLSRTHARSMAGTKYRAQTNDVISKHDTYEIKESELKSVFGTYKNEKKTSGKAQKDRKEAPFKRNSPSRRNLPSIK